jgi:catalase
MVDALNGQFGVHTGCPAIHAKGTWSQGTFVANGALARLTTAPQLAGGTHTVVSRLSNGDGRPDSPDGEAFSLGFAVSFLGDGIPISDLMMVDSETFITNDPDEFLGFSKSNATTQTGQANVLKSGTFAAVHPKLTAAAIRKQRAPIAASYASQKWHAVHAYLLVDADENQKPVRFSWVPVAGESYLSRDEAKKLPPNYLGDDMKSRLETDPIEFDLEVTLADDSDTLIDSTIVWPNNRARIVAGRLTLDTWLESYSPHRFVPNRYGEGIRPSSDPLIMARTWTYQESYRRRKSEAYDE